MKISIADLRKWGAFERNRYHIEQIAEANRLAWCGTFREFKAQEAHLKRLQKAFGDPVGNINVYNAVGTPDK